MKMNRYIGMLVGVIALFSACQNESLEDTYKDYAGEGEIRYVGKCTGLLVSPGWKRIIAKWENNEDPIIKKVKVKWRLEEQADSILLERGTTEYSIESINGAELEDGNYEVSVCGVDEGGNEAIPISTMGRPYTYAHEEVRTFNRIISNLYVIRDRLVLFLFDWQDAMKSASLSYTKADGSTGTLVLNKELCDQHYYLLPDAIDPEDLNLILNRRGELPGCQDEIDFEPYEFSTAKVYEADFLQEMKRQYGYDEIIPEDWANMVETLYLDWSISSLSSLLNFPNLKKLVLGSRRYLMSDAAVNDVDYGQSSLAEQEASNFVLEVMHELTGLTVERYNKHFQQLTKTDYIEDISRVGVDPALEDLAFIDLSGLEFEEYPEIESFVSHLDRLTDGDFSTSWSSYYSNTFLSYELTIDLKEEKTLNGMRFVQNQWKEQEELAWSQEYIRIMVSKNGMNWENATYVEDSQLGKTNGEINYITFSDEVKAEQYRYVRIELNTALYGGIYRVGIAEISLW